MATENPNVRHRRPFSEAAQPVGQPPHPPASQPSAVQSNIEDIWLRVFLKYGPPALVTFSSITAAYNARSDPWTLAFIFTAYTSLMLFYWFVDSYKTTPPEKRLRHKIIVWVLATILIVIFPYKLTPTMPFALAAGIWIIGGIVIALIFYLFFIYED